MILSNRPGCQGLGSVMVPVLGLFVRAACMAILPPPICTRWEAAGAVMTRSPVPLSQMESTPLPGSPQSLAWNEKAAALLTTNFFRPASQPGICPCR